MNFKMLISVRVASLVCSQNRGKSTINTERDFTELYNKRIVSKSEIIFTYINFQLTYSLLPLSRVLP